MLRNIIIVTLALLIQLPSFAQETASQAKTKYIEQYKLYAVVEMYRSGIPASITLAQGILESGSGNSLLAREANNHFGIKCHTNWTGETFYQDDDAKNECFRKYKSVEDSYIDHSNFLKTRQRYAFLFELDKTDYKGWAKGLKTAGYATNPKYADLLIKQIEDLGLHKYDLLTPDDVKTLIEDEPMVVSTAPKIQNKEQKVAQFNGIKHIVANGGESPLSIAEQFKMLPNLIYKYNDIDIKAEFAFEKGEKIYLQPKKRKGTAEKHIVGKTESLRDISQKYGVKLERLYKLNDINPNLEPAEGATITLRKKNKDKVRTRTRQEMERRKLAAKKPETVKPDMKKEEPAPQPKVETPTPNKTVTPPNKNQETQKQNASASSEKHTVVKGDTLYNISKRYGLTVDELKSLNKLGDDGIKIGDVLIIKK